MYCVNIGGFVYKSYKPDVNVLMPRDGILCNSMKHTRSLFKTALRCCKRSANQIRADSLAQNMGKHDYKTFWRDVRSQQNSKLRPAVSVGGATGSSDIINMWVDHYKSIFKSDNACADDIKEFMESICNVPYSSYMYVSSDEIHEAVSSLKMGKSPGIDCVYAEHIKYAGEVLFEPLRILMSSMLIHGYMPENMIKGVIVPIIKSKTKGVNDKKNYRPVCLSTMISKIFEHILLNRLKPHLETCHNQFGFKPKMGTELCILTLKEHLAYYHNLGSQLFICFMDASSAFDKIQFVKLFEKIKNRKVEMYLIRILCYWYMNQTLCI